MDSVRRLSTMLFMVWIVYGSLVPVVQAGNTYTSASCSLSDVRAVAESSSNLALTDGDTVIISSVGSPCTWGNNVNGDVALTVTKAINIAGQSFCTNDVGGLPTSCPTQIKNNMYKGDAGTCAGGQNLISFSPTNNDQLISWVIHDLQIIGLATDFGRGCPVADLGFSTLSHSFRLHHLLFSNRTSPSTAFFGDMWGVIDHVRFGLPGESVHKAGSYVAHDRWGGVARDNGNNSWASADTFGTIQAVYFENVEINDNTLQGAGLIDTAYGGRWVIRNSTFSFTGTHGTESTGPVTRGTRQGEIYNNTIVSQPGGTAQSVLFRSGTMRYFLNTSGCLNNDCVNNPMGFIALENDRDFDKFGEWGPGGTPGACDGTSPFDNNTGIIYFSGTARSGSTTDHLVDTSQNFSSVLTGGYSVLNTTQNWSSTLRMDNSSTSTILNTAGSLFGSHPWTVGDSYQVRKAYPCLDQIGRGKGNLISGNPPTPAAWPNQASDPIYQWLNTLSGANAQIVAGQSQHFISDRDFFDYTTTYNGTTGMGSGIRVVRPASPTLLNTAWWSTDQGGNWDTTNATANDGCLDVWDGSVWVNCQFTPFIYPHPLITGSAGHAPPGPPTNFTISQQEIEWDR